tara:strand:- start:1923 stop:2126 length:204 start_codon:yes stop_codon:yes gene_type:complete
MKYTVDTETKTIEVEFTPMTLTDLISEMKELDNMYKDYTIEMKNSSRLTVTYPHFPTNQPGTWGNGR